MLDSYLTPDTAKEGNIAAGPNEGKARKSEKKARSTWRFNNRFEVLAEDSDDSSDDHSNSEKTNSAPANPTSSSPASDNNAPVDPTTADPATTYPAPTTPAPSDEATTATAPAAPADSTPRDARDHDEHEKAQDQEQEDNAKETNESDGDSAIDSEGEDPHNPPVRACPLCNETLEDRATAVLQHVKALSLIHISAPTRPY